MSAFATLYFIFLSVMVDKIEHQVCTKFCKKLGISTTETLEMFSEALGECSLSQTALEWHSYFKASRVSVEEHSGKPSTSKMT
jgi:hypothetical protein